MSTLWAVLLGMCPCSFAMYLACARPSSGLTNSAPCLVRHLQRETPVAARVRCRM